MVGSLPEVREGELCLVDLHGTQVGPVKEMAVQHPLLLRSQRARVPAPHALVSLDQADHMLLDEGDSLYVRAVVAACTSMTLRMFTDRKGWPLKEAVARSDRAPFSAAPLTVAPRPIPMARMARGISRDVSAVGLRPRIGRGTRASPLRKR